MKINEERKDGIIIASVEGEINIDTSSALRKAFDEYIKEGSRGVIIDCGSLSYIDSSGLATLIELLQRLKKTGAKLRICSLSGKVKSVFEVTKLDKVFAIYPGRDQALEGFE